MINDWILGGLCVNVVDVVLKLLHMIAACVWR